MAEIKWILKKFFAGCVIIGLMWFLIAVFRNTMMSYEYNAEGEDYIKKNHNVTKIDLKNVNEDDLKLDIPEFDFGK